ncbi:MAG TPA: hypothetical protein DIU20_04105 [Cryomorphaceae bacterium]|nr:hypothetical protein [Owenweeksia sp.]HCQ15420.1 hypothetical protein [Cryomorphaceae bacterium]|tara:strand:+ start:16905 stop:17726 length:822 start_codon:yes stop_codon:yes gene_type:complete
MKIKLLIFKILLASLWLPAYGQYTEVGLFGGGSNFIGDVGDYGIHIPKGYAVGGFVRYNFNERWALRLQFNYGYIANEDSSSSFGYRLNRNLHFRSHILEGSLMGEFNFLDFEPGTKHFHTPYVMGGFGIFKFNPTAVYQGEEYELQPLGTEGQGTRANASGPYPLASTFFVFGLGYKFSIGEFTSIAIESNFRSTRTDYLDDVSGYYADPEIIEEENGPVAAALSDRSILGGDKENLLRGNPQNNDWYIFTGITLQFKFGELYEKCASFVGR